jgi:PPM family protein phosphatase
MRLQSFGLSDIGLSRRNNEDVWTALNEIGFFAIADGMGGHKAGEVAASEAIEHLSTTAKKLQKTDILQLVLDLRKAIEKTNRWVYRLGQGSPLLTGMGTTLCCLIWTAEGIVYAHVGDSRIYRLRHQKLELLTEDHSLFARWLATGKLAEECETPFPYKNVITRAVGTSSQVEPEVAVATHEIGDLYLLCTDGLSDVLTLSEIEVMLNRSTSLENTAHELIRRAKSKGSSDNMTLLLIRSHTDAAI